MKKTFNFLTKKSHFHFIQLKTFLFLACECSLIPTNDNVAAPNTTSERNYTQTQSNNEHLFQINEDLRDFIINNVNPDNIRNNLR